MMTAVASAIAAVAPSMPNVGASAKPCAGAFPNFV
jgi:hypothetical protein